MSSIITFEHPTLIMGRQNSVSGGVFDADLDDGTCTDNDNAELYLMMRIYFYDAFNDPKIVTKDPADPKKGFAKDHGGVEFHCKPWSAGDFTAWKSKLLRTCQKFWHGRFWLETPTSYKGLDFSKNGKKYRPNVWCRFELSAADSDAGAHFKVAVANISGPKNPTHGFQFRSNMFLYDVQDPINTKKHEVGHLLGLDHPGGNCNNAACYADKPGFPGDVMGSGNKIYPHHAAPWQKAISLITSTTAADWKASRTKVFPKKI
ncbi:MAG: hypothetical protein U1D30_15435 [Planctomycetota bacterium]